MKLIAIKKVALAIGIGAGCTAVGLAATAGAFGNDLSATKADTYSLTLDSNGTPEGLTSDYQNSFDSHFTTAGGFDIAATFVLAKSASNSYVQLASRGLIYNTEPIHGLTGITVNGSGSVSIRTAISEYTSSGAYYGDSSNLTLGSKFTLAGTNYFQLMAGDNGATITSIVLEFTCEEPEQVANSLYGVWTGQDSAGNRYKLTLGSSCQLQTLKKIPAFSLNSGSLSLSGTDLTVTFSDLTFNATVSSDNQTLTFVSSSGNKASEFTGVNFNRVYNVENFESYSASGNGWSSQNGAGSQYTATGARAHYYADYYGSQPVASPLGGTGWSMMGSGDYMQFTANSGRDGSKAIGFKGNNANCRYFQMNAFYGVKQKIGKGSTMSFWAKSPYSNNGLSTMTAGEDTVIKLWAYYQSKVTSGTLTTNRTVKEFTIPAYSGWTEYTMPLDSSKEYYSFAFVCSKSSTYTVIDDISIYTVSPYEGTNYPSDTYWIRTSISSYSTDMLLSFNASGIAAASVATNHLYAQSVAYDEVSGQFELDMGTDTITYSSTISFTIGKITGTYDKVNNRLTGVGCDGSISSKLDSNSMTLAPRSTDYYHNFDGTTEQLQNKYNRRYLSNDTWVVDTSNTNRIIANTSDFAGGTSAKLKSWDSGAVGLTMKTDKQISATNICFWVYNPNTTDVRVRTFVYTSANYGSNHEIIQGGFICAAGEWTFCDVGFSKRTIYNFQLDNFGNNARPLSFDNVLFFD